MNSRRLSSGSSMGPRSFALKLPRLNSTSADSRSGRNLFRTVILTAWDNILGPNAVATWNLIPPIEDGKEGGVDEDTFQFPEPKAFLPFIANHTLNGEICRDFSGGNIDVKISTFVLNDNRGGSRSIASSTFIFSSTTSAGHAATHSLALLFDAQLMQTYFVIHDIVAQRLKRMIGKYRVLSERPSLRQTALATLTADLNFLCEFVSHWRRFGLHTSQLVSTEETFFSPHQSCDPAFLRKAIASHLVTAGCSVVVGCCPHKANLMIGTLSLLLNSRERRLCTYLQPTKYFPGLLVQGILKDSVEAGAALTKDPLLSASLPTTIVDMDNHRVQRTSSISKHRSLRREMIVKELEDLYGRRPHQTEDDAVPKSFVNLDAPKFERGHFDETLVAAFLGKIEESNRDDVDATERKKDDDDDDEDDDEKRLASVENAVAEFRSDLFSKTKAFVRLIFDYLKTNEENRADAQSRPSSSSAANNSGNVNNDNNNNNNNRPTSPVIRKLGLVNDFLENRGLNSRDDLLLLVSTAERFKPGFDDLFHANFEAVLKRAGRT